MAHFYVIIVAIPPGDNSDRLPGVFDPWTVRAGLAAGILQSPSQTCHQVQLTLKVAGRVAHDWFLGPVKVTSIASAKITSTMAMAILAKNQKISRINGVKTIPNSSSATGTPI